MDIHTAATTVAEALWFSARLRLPTSVTDDQVGGGGGGRENPGLQGAAGI